MPVQALAAARPDAHIARSANWCGFPERFCCVRALDPLDPLFQEVGSAFIKVGGKRKEGGKEWYRFSSRSGLMVFLLERLGGGCALVYGVSTPANV